MWKKVNFRNDGSAAIFGNLECIITCLKQYKGTTTEIFILVEHFVF